MTWSVSSTHKELQRYDAFLRRTVHPDTEVVSQRDPADLEANLARTLVTTSLPNTLSQTQMVNVV